MRKLVFVAIAVSILAQPMSGQSPWPTKSWPTSTPPAEGLDAKVLGAFDADIAAGKYGNVDSMLVIRHGKIVFDRTYKHDYDTIYAKSRRARTAERQRPDRAVQLFQSLVAPVLPARRPAHACSR